MANDLRVLITGATGGLGEAFSHQFHDLGYKLVLSGRDQSKLEALASRLGGDPELIAIDLGLPGAASELFDRLETPIDVLVNNAGFSHFAPFHESDHARLVEMLLVNVRSVTDLSRLCLPHMVERKRGGIINVASTAAFMPGPLMAEYYATKAYVLSLSEAIGEELKGSGVNVTCLCPGSTRSGFQAAAEMSNSKLMNGAFMEPKAVVRAGIDGFLKGKRVVIPGLMNRIQALTPRFLPRSMVPKIVLNAQKPK